MLGIPFISFLLSRSHDDLLGSHHRAHGGRKKVHGWKVFDYIKTGLLILERTRRMKKIVSG
jgi:hypothetical protein